MRWQLVIVKTKNLDPALIPLVYAAIVSMLNMIFGFELGMLFCNQSEYAEFFVEAANRTHVIIGAFVLGFIFGSFIAGYITYGSGRKITIVSSSVIGTLSVISSNVAPNFTVMMCSYFVIGFSFGMYLVPSLLYICELVLPSSRSLAMMLIPFFFFVGMELSLFISSPRSIESIVIYALLVILNFILISVALVKLPESPRFLALTGSTDAALSILFKLRRNMGVAARELAEINECCRGESRGIELYLQNTVCRRLLTFLCICILLFNISGASIMPYILVDFFNYQVQCDENNMCDLILNQYVLILCFTAILLSIIWHILALARYAHRSLLLVDVLLGTGFLFLTTVGCILPVSSFQNWFVLLSLMAFIFVFLGGFVTFVCVMSVELLVIRGREFGMAALCIACGVGFLFDLQMFKPMFNLLTIYGVFLSCSILATFLCYLLYSLMPVTEILSLEEIEGHVMSVQYFSDLAENKQLEESEARKRQLENEQLRASSQEVYIQGARGYNTFDR